MGKNHRVEVALGDEIFQRLEKYCQTMVIDRAVFIKLATVEKLTAIEEREAFIKSQKNPTKRATGAGHVPTTSATGMQIEIKTPAPAAPTEKGALPEKLTKSFRRYCEYVEASEDAREYSMRLQICFDELKERAGDKQQDANVAFLALQDLLKQRKDLKPKEVMSLPEGVPLDGDVSDE